MNVDSLPQVMVAVAQSLALPEVLRAIVGGIADCRHVALTRIWLFGPGDLCASCRFAEECVDRSRCLHLIASVVYVDGAIFDAGNLHGYLSGAGIELMGNSDNVIRGGLTVKHVDIDDLLAVVDPTPLDDPVLPRGDVYELPAANVALRRLSAGSTHTATGHELAVDLAGGTWYLAPGETATFPAETYVVVPL